MKITLGDAVDGTNALDMFMRSFELPLRLGYDLGKTLKSLRDESEIFNGLITELEKRYATKDARGQSVLDPAKTQEYIKEVKELRAKEIEVWGRKPITLTELETHIRKARKQARPDENDYEVMIAPALLAPLHWLIVEDEIDSAIESAGIECIPQ